VVISLPRYSAYASTDFMALQMLLLLFFGPSGVKIPRVKSKVKSKRKAEVVTARR